MVDALEDDEVESNLPNGWELDGDEIVRTYEFEDYLVGMSFAVEVAELAEEEFHHPEMTIGYETVEVRYTTHEHGGITERDIKMAGLTDELR
ncbi:Pterin-4a-carbinolamine dehydratase [Halanaeroarchaeum sp. HSR-CO]|uniref:4a-hydroxytetrahydrobiopterin dehydratase n=1 Tax=Halanaeroarchaeum sp. HSR-CO TaxID=2866382 RepID=UPI00217EBC80|nr:4a-hydroxytetrahydrobiopterin dehydratase [Halanaeroarchaeum sp. HSR-CO]UWG48720.1 Pterin-4a-carbinolamine dehydratase [Halanaeroarchaeum sp. HSR-CO]